MDNIGNFLQDLTESDDDFRYWYDEVFQGSDLDEETARIAWMAGRVTGLRFGYAFTDQCILDELARLGAI